jgi:hypothetical protein
VAQIVEALRYKPEGRGFDGVISIEVCSKSCNLVPNTKSRNTILISIIIFFSLFIPIIITL